jgi:hypothetical protein
MIFNAFYDNYKTKIESFFIEHKIRGVEKLYELKKDTYRSNIINDTETSYIINHDLTKFLSVMFGFSDKSIKSIKKEVSFLNALMHVKQDSMDFADLNTVLIKKSINKDLKKDITLTFLWARLSLSITASSVVMYDSNGYIKLEPTTIDGDVDNAIIEAIQSFNLELANLIDVDTPKFNKSFFDNIKNSSDTTVIKRRIKNDYFQFIEKNDIEHLLYPVRLKERFSSIWVGDDNCVMIASKYPQLFLNCVKTILKGVAYKHFVQAFNFYHNYKLMMNEQFMSTIKFEFEHKLAPLDTAVITISIGCEFEITISTPVSKEKNMRMSVFGISEYDKTTDETNALASDDLHELYDFIFPKCSQKISELLNKDAMELEWRDIQVLRMIKI